MDRFPAEFLDLLNKRALRNDSVTRPTLRQRKVRMAWFPMLLSSSSATRCISLLERRLIQHLSPIRRRIPASTIYGMRRNYSETLPKTLSNRTVILNSSRSKAARTAAEIGLLEMLRSDSLREFAERVSGYKLDPDPGCQVVCYEPGDYVGPHNDHHPEVPHLKGGYVDLHITLSNRSVDHQWLVHEDRGFFTQVVNIAAQSGVAVSYLPFWHYTTPLVAKKGRERHARRWLLLASFAISGRLFSPRKASAIG